MRSSAEENTCEATEVPLKKRTVLRITTRETALIAIFSAICIASEIVLGRVVGRFSLGPISLHGVVNRVVGWMLMLIMAETCQKFGRVTLMSLVAALGTRIIRVSALEGLVVGAGYALGGFTFDLLFFIPPMIGLGKRSRELYLILASAISGSLAITPYLLYKFAATGPVAFLALLPLYVVSTTKGILFSIAGTSLGLSIYSRIKGNLQAHGGFL
jgi:hypothetical protein